MKLLYEPDTDRVRRLLEALSKRARGEATLEDVSLLLAVVADQLIVANRQLHGLIVRTRKNHE